MPIRLPVHSRTELCRGHFLLSSDHPHLGPLEPTSLGFSPALVGPMNRGDHQFQSIPALLPSPLEDADNLLSNQPNDLITPTPKLLQNNVQQMAPRHDKAAQHASIVDLPGNLQGSNI